MLSLEVDAEGDLIYQMGSSFPNKNAEVFTSLTALGYGILSILQDSQEDIAKIGLDYMAAHDITFESILAEAMARRRIH
jgi:hypothetical protein